MITQGETSSPAQTPLTTEIETCSKESEKPTSADAQCKLIVPNTTTHSLQASPLWNPDSKNLAKGPEMNTAYHNLVGGDAAVKTHPVFTVSDVNAPNVQKTSHQKVLFHLFKQ